MPKINKFRPSGFSLVELMVVVAVIIILASIGLATYIQADIKSRDNQRISDLKQVQVALEQYHNDLGWYPKTTDIDFNGGGQIFASLPPNPVTQQSIINVYLNILPRDPKYYSGSSHKNYMYLSKPNILLGDLSDCNNLSGGIKCYDYCLYADVEIPPGANNSSCFTDAFKVAYPDYDYNLRNRNGN